jgi:hypothetical protein
LASPAPVEVITFPESEKAGVAIKLTLETDAPGETLQVKEEGENM